MAGSRRYGRQSLESSQAAPTSDLLSPTYIYIKRWHRRQLVAMMPWNRLVASLYETLMLQNVTYARKTAGSGTAKAQGIHSSQRFSLALPLLG